MKTKLICLLIALSSATAMWADRFKFRGVYYETTSDSTVCVTYQKRVYFGTENNYNELTSVTIPSYVYYLSRTYRVTSINEYTFDGCKGLTSITIPEGIIYIGQDAFRGCTGLASITMPNSVTSGAKDVLDDTQWYKNQPDGLVYIDNVLYKYKGTMPDNTNAIVKEGTAAIYSYAFADCTGLASVSIPNSVTGIGEYVFSGCRGLTSIVVESGNMVYDSRNNCNAIIETATNTLMHGCGTTIIPNSITSIGYRAFSGCTGLTSITIPNSVTNIDTYAFSNCTRLTSITLPNSVTNIGAYAFSSCTSLTSFTIPNGVTIINESIFEGCSSLVSIDIPNSVTYIDISAFGDCYSLTSITIPDSVTSMYGPPFRGCRCLTTIIWNAQNCSGHNGNMFRYVAPQITSITFGNKVETIPTNLCYGMQKLTAITIPESVTYIGLSAFEGCSSLVSIDIPNSVTTIGWSAFQNCTGLTSVNISNGVTSIETSAFEGCSKLASIDIPNSVTDIGESAFKNCTSLVSVTLGDNVTSIGNEAFAGTPWYENWYKNQPNGIVYIGKMLYGYKGTMPANTHLVVREGTTRINGFAFEGCTGLVSITIPNSVTSIGNYAFSGCTSLTSITFPDSITGIGLYTFKGCTGLTSITIPKGIRYISSSAFDDCENLTSVIWNAQNCGDTGGCSHFGNVVSQITSFTLGDDVDSIPDALFKGMTKLTSITIPKGVRKCCIFTDCPNLTSVVWNAQQCEVNTPFYYIADQITSFTFGDDVDSIPDLLCQRMKRLTSIIIPDGVKSIGYGAFDNCTGLTSLTIPDSVTYLTPISSCTGLTSVSIGKSVTYIGGFSGCTALRSVNIPKGVTYLGGFKNCTSLTSLVLPDGVKYIGDCSGCTALKSINIPNSVTAFEGFGGCTSLGSVTISDSVTDIKDQAFFNCSSLSSVTIGKNVKKIGWVSFAGCKRLTSIVIPDSVTIIANQAFDGCERLANVTFPANLDSVGFCAFEGCTSLKNIVWNVRKSYNGYTMKNTPFYYYKPSISGYIDMRSQIQSFAFGNDVESIPAGLCAGMKKMTTVNLGNSVKSIGSNAFSGCQSITSITFPESLTSIGSSAFEGCTKIRSKITIPVNVSYIGEGAFRNCTGINSVRWNARNCTDGWSSAWVHLSPFLGVSYFTFGDEVESIPDCLCAQLTISSVTIPASVTSIGFRAFYKCSRLTSITVQAEVPPVANRAAFEEVPTDIPVYIPCGTKEAYQSAEGWKNFTNYIEPAGFTLNVTSQDVNKGTIEMIEMVSCANGEAVFKAVANEHYHFTRWSDGNTDNPRTITLTQDMSLVAEFAPNQYTITTSAQNGRVTGDGTYDYGTTVTLTATADEHYHFTRWNDGNTDNPRRVKIEGDATYTAEFALDRYSIVAHCDTRRGVVAGTGTYDYGTQVTLSATANEGYEFAQWSNGVTDNPYIFTVTEEITLEAQFISTTAVENVPASDATTPQKVFRDGQVYILRDGKTYTLTGVEIE